MLGTLPESHTFVQSGRVIGRTEEGSIAPWKTLLAPESSFIDRSIVHVDFVFTPASC